MWYCFGEGSSGASFLVEMNAKNPKMEPPVQGVMIADYGNEAFAFKIEVVPND